MKNKELDWLKIYCNENKGLFDDYESITPRQRFCIELSIKYYADLMKMTFEEIDKLISKEDSDKLKLIIKYGDSDQMGYEVQGRIDLRRGEIPYRHTLSALSHGCIDDIEVLDKVAMFVAQLGGYKRNEPLH